MIIAHVNQRELDVYDSYPTLMGTLGRFANMPFREMSTALDRIEATGAYIGPRGTQAVDREAVELHRALIGAALNFRDAYNEIASRVPGDND